MWWDILWKLFLLKVFDCDFYVWPEPALTLLGSVSCLKTAHIPINMIFIMWKLVFKANVVYFFKTLGWYLALNSSSDIYLSYFLIDCLILYIILKFWFDKVWSFEFIFYSSSSRSSSSSLGNDVNFLVSLAVNSPYVDSA